MAIDVPQGWYPDPQLAGAVRWWNGKQWTLKLKKIDDKGNISDFPKVPPTMEEQVKASFEGLLACGMSAVVIFGLAYWVLHEELNIFMEIGVWIAAAGLGTIAILGLIGAGHILGGVVRDAEEGDLGATSAKPAVWWTLRRKAIATIVAFGSAGAVGLLMASLDDHETPEKTYCQKNPASDSVACGRDPTGQFPTRAPSNRDLDPVPSVGRPK